MLNWLANRNRAKRVARILYDRIVAQSRLPVFYAGLGVPDTLMGRFELLALHMFAGLERLRLDGPPAEPVSQRLVDLFCADMDTTMRELGVGDLSVGKEVRAAADALYARLRAYRAAVAAEDDGALAAAIRQRLAACEGGAAADSLARYVIATLRMPAPRGPMLAEDGRMTFAQIAADADIDGAGLEAPGS